MRDVNLRLKQYHSLALQTVPVGKAGPRGGSVVLFERQLTARSLEVFCRLGPAIADGVFTFCGYSPLASSMSKITRWNLACSSGLFKY